MRSAASYESSPAPIATADAAYRAAKAAAGLTALNLLVSGLAFVGVAVLGGWLVLGARSRSAAENFAETVDDAHLTASAFDEVVRRLPDGLDERVGERGLRLSGGQRQRLLLARALHQPQRLIVLHEPTTVIDPITEARVAAGLAEEGRTILLLTDCASLLSACHRVHDLRESTHE